MLDALPEGILRHTEIFRKTRDAEKFRCTPVDHFFVKPHFIPGQLFPALFAYLRLHGWHIEHHFTPLHEPNPDMQTILKRFKRGAVYKTAEETFLKSFLQFLPG